MERLSKNTWSDYKQYQEKVLQFGEGNFLRAFVDWQIDILNKETNFNGSVVVVQPRGSEKIKKINNQDGLFTLILQGMKEGEIVNESMVVNSISRGINLFTNYNDYLELAAKDELRFIVSNTTEAGIVFDESDRLEDRPQKKFPGKLSAFLYHRYQSFRGDNTKGCIIIPCELIENNGEKLKEIVLQYASLWKLEDGFVRWIHEANTFCSSLVDRIVPGFPTNLIEEIKAVNGYIDELVVVGEPYHLWVIEGPEWIKEEFPVGNTKLNTFVVDNLTPYLIRKVRILNGTHTAMTPVAYLYGLDSVGEAVEHEVIGKFIKELIFEEIIPTLDLPKADLEAYANDVLDRFKNPFLTHQLTSIALNSMSKFKTRDLPSLQEYILRKGLLPRKLVFSLSALISFYKGKRGEEEIQVAEEPRILALFKSLWEGYDGTEDSIKNIVFSVLGYEDHWEMNLNELTGLTNAVAEYLIKIDKQGIKEAIKEVMVDSDKWVRL